MEMRIKILIILAIEVSFLLNVDCAIQTFGRAIPNSVPGPLISRSAETNYYISNVEFDDTYYLIGYEIYTIVPGPISISVIFIFIFIFLFFLIFFHLTQ